MSSRALALTRDSDDNPLWRVAGLLLRPLHLGLAFPSILYVAAMSVFLFRPPDLFSFYADRIAFGILVFFVALRTMALRDRIPFFAGVSLPMLGLMALAVFRAFQEPFDAQTWSIIASKFIVPFALFHLAVLVFRGGSQRKHFEIFVILALAQERKTVVRLLWLVLPLAVLATMTRAVWISFAVSTVVLGFRLVEWRLQAVCTLLAAAGLLVGLAIGLSDHSLKTILWDRTAERGPVAARLAVYDAGWAMFEERPFTGWPAGGMYAELARRMEGYHLRTFYVHNTYLALLVEFGVPGLALYGILFFNLFRLSWRGPPGEAGPVASLRKVWPILLSVYLFNAFFVDMAYQFVIGLMFTVAGMLCASRSPSHDHYRLHRQRVSFVPRTLRDR